MRAKFWAWVASARWYLLAAISAVLALFVLFLRITKRTPPELPAGQGTALPEVPRPLQDKVRAAEEQALVARVQATAQAEAHREALVEIAKVDDGAERRRRLAAMLQNLPK